MDKVPLPAATVPALSSPIVDPISAVPLPPVFSLRPVFTTCAPPRYPYSTAPDHDPGPSPWAVTVPALRISAFPTHRIAPLGNTSWPLFTSVRPPSIEVPQAPIEVTVTVTPEVIFVVPLPASC